MSKRATSIPATAARLKSYVRRALAAVGTTLREYWYRLSRAIRPVEKAIRVLPLGDSLTHGESTPGAYRTELWRLAKADGLRVRFVGSKRNGPPELQSKAHEGHRGWRIDEISAHVEHWLRVYRPQVVLLLIGSNDVGQEFELASAPARLAALVDQITKTAPEAYVIVGSSPLVGDVEVNQRIQAYNAAIPALVDVRGRAAKRIAFADLYSAIGVDDLMPDLIHLKPSGNIKLAAVWYAALRELVIDLRSYEQ